EDLHHLPVGALARPLGDPLVDLVVAGGPTGRSGQVRTTGPLRVPHRLAELLPVRVVATGDRAPPLLARALVNAPWGAALAAVALRADRTGLETLLQEVVGQHAQHGLDLGHLDMGTDA